jgi:hypothetical protein
MSFSWIRSCFILKVVNSESYFGLLRRSWSGNTSDSNDLEHLLIQLSIARGKLAKRATKTRRAKGTKKSTKSKTIKKRASKVADAGAPAAAAPTASPLKSAPKRAKKAKKGGKNKRTGKKAKKGGKRSAKK